MAELLRCPLLSVGGRTYRVYSRAAPSLQLQSVEHIHGDDGGFWEDEAGEDVEDVDDADIVQEGDQFVAVISLDSELFGLLIGPKGTTKQRIEQDTGCSIYIPRRDAQPAPGSTGTTSNSITLKGSSRRVVARAKAQVQMLLAGALSGRRLDYNYFLSIPLATPATSAGLAAFRDTVLAQPEAAASGIEPSIFMHEKHLHLTIAMLKLYSDEARALAAATLRSLAPMVQATLADGPLRLRLHGLEYMNDEPGAMHVLYLGVHDGAPGALDRLQRLCGQVLAAFSTAGLLQAQDERPLKLHATVINTRYRKRVHGSDTKQQQHGGRGSSEQRQPFDGRGLLHRGLDLGELDLPAVHLSQRGRYDQTSGYYHCAESLPLVAA